MPLGFLVVFAECGNQVSLEEFQDWYDNEHIPLRLNHLPSFLTCARFSASDSLAPSWLALYDVTDTAAFQHDSYTRLRTDRSPREADLVRRLELLDRRTYELLSDSGESALTSSFRSSDPTAVVVTHGMAVSSPDLDADKVLEGWAGEAFRVLTGVEGWVRSRVYKCIDNLRVGTGVGKGPEAQSVPRYLAVHEMLSSAVADSAAFQAIIQKADLEVKVVEDRRWELYRAYPGIAQGNMTTT